MRKLQLQQSGMPFSDLASDRLNDAALLLNSHLKIQ